MARKTVTANKEPSGIKYSAAHDYYYGHGSKEAYEKELNSVKAELRYTVYGGNEGGKKSDAPRPVNGAAIAITVISALAILVIALVAVLVITDTMEFGLYDDSVALVRGFIDRMSDFELGIAETAAICAIIGAFFTLTTFFGAIADTRSKGIGKGMVFGASFAFLANVALTVAGMGGEDLPIIRIVLTALSLIALLIALFGGRKSEKK